jgi:hypothetical protein
VVAGALVVILEMAEILLMAVLVLLQQPLRAAVVAQGSQVLALITGALVAAVALDYWGKEAVALVQRECLVMVALAVRAAVVVLLGLEPLAALVEDMAVAAVVALKALVVLKALPPCVLSGPALLVASHQQIQETCNA